MTDKEKYEFDIICPLIQQNRIIKFFYKDTTKHKEEWRTVMPHLIGLHKTTANVILVAWFLPTEQQYINGDEQKWGNYLLGSIYDVEKTAQVFTKTMPLYNPNDKRMSAIYCRTPLSH